MHVRDNIESMNRAKCARANNDTFKPKSKASPDRVCTDIVQE